MAQAADLDYILADCFLAAGQAVGPKKTVDLDAVVWWHRRYWRAFQHAMTTQGTSWSTDRDRVTAVGRYLGQRAVGYAGVQANIDQLAAARASAEVEHGCRMTATREAFLPADHATSSVATAL